MADTFLGRRLIAATRLARYERKVEAAIGRALARQRAATLDNLTKRALTAAGVFDEDEWDTDVLEEVAPIIEQMLKDLSEGVISKFQFGKAAGLILGQIDVESQVEHFLRLVTGIGPDLARRVHDELAHGVGLGESVPKLAARVEGVFAMAERKALAIARTETNRAANNGINTAASAVNEALPINKTWLATMDERVRDDHADADGQTVGFDEPFDVGGESAMFPCDPDLSAEQSVNCRCTVIFEAAEDATGEEVDAAIADLEEQAEEESLVADAGTA